MKTQQYVIVDKDGVLLSNEVDIEIPEGEVLTFGGEMAAWDMMGFIMWDSVSNCYRGWRIEEYDPAKHIWRKDDDTR